MASATCASIQADTFRFPRCSGFTREHISGRQYINGVCASPSPVVLHGNNLLVFGGTGIPFGESNGNDVHVCNVKYKRWALLSCRGKKPSRIYGQVPIHGRSWWIYLFGFFWFWGQCQNLYVTISFLNGE